MTPTYESHATSCLSLAGFWSLLTGNVPHRNACMIFVSWHLCFDEVIKLSILRSWKTFRCFTCMTLVLYQHCSLINLHITDLLFAMGEEGIIPLRGCHARSHGDSPRNTLLPEAQGPRIVHKGKVHQGTEMLLGSAIRLLVIRTHHPAAAFILPLTHY